MSKASEKKEIELRQMDLAIARNYEKIDEASHFIVQLEDLERILLNHPDREIHITITKKRIGHLLHKMLDKNLDPTDQQNLIWHGEMRGRLMEQIEHVNILQSIGAHKSFLERAKSALQAAIEGIAGRQTRKAGDK
jgi:hypothetical protein